MNDENIAPPQQNSSTWKAIAKEIIIFIIIAVGIVLPFRIYVAEPYIVDGVSMDPTFHTGDYLIVDKISYELGTQPERNSVIVFKFPTDTSRDLIKRVIGLPGDTLTVTNGVITITNAANPQGFILPEPYLVHTQADTFTVTLAPDQFFVMGDNRPESYDSRSWGILPRSDILGRPVLRLLPLTQIGALPGNATQ